MKRISRVGAAAGLFFAIALLVPSAAQAAACGTPAKEAVYKTVVTPGVPAVTEEVKVIDQAYVPAVPGTPEIPAVPAVEEVSHIDHVLVTPAVPATPDKWWNWSPNKDQGPFEGPPAFPTDERGTWEGPHENGGPDQDTYGTFNSSNSDNGRASWFHRDKGTDEVPAVYKDVKVIDVEAKPAIPAVPAVPEVPAVEEVSHMETRIVTPAVPEKTETVLVSKAVEAGPPCVVPPEDEPNPPAASPVPVVDNPPLETLAYTGSDADALKWALALLVGGLAFMGLGRKLAPKE